MKAIFYPPFFFFFTCLVCCLIPCVSLQEEDGETESGCRGELTMVLGVTHMHALGPRVPLAPPASLSLMTTFIMYSEGIIPPSLPLSVPHAHSSPSSISS